MDEALKGTLTEAGIDVDGAMERFMNNDNMFKKFQLKFPNDPNVGLLKEGLATDDCDKAFRAAHTLKGVCGNLSYVNLAKISSEVTECLRAKDMESAKQKMPELEAEYNRIIEVINKYLS